MTTTTTTTTTGAVKSTPNLPVNLASSTLQLQSPPFLPPSLPIPPKLPPSLPSSHPRLLPPQISPSSNISTSSSSAATKNWDRTGIDDSFTCKPDEEYDPLQPNDYTTLASKERLELQLLKREQREKQQNAKSVTKVDSSKRRKGQQIHRSAGRGRNISNLPAWLETLSSSSSTPLVKR